MKYAVHSSAILEPRVTIGARTRIWAFTHILSGVKIGADCNICDHVFIESGVSIGDRTTIKCGVQLWSGIRVGDDVFIGPNATFTNDLFPRSRRHLDKHPETILEEKCSIGANATILPGIVIGRGAMVGAGAVVTKSVPPNAIVVGNPAEIIGYDGYSNPVGSAGVSNFDQAGESLVTNVRGVTYHRMPLIQDLRGDLSVGEFEKNLPFSPKRYFLVFNVKKREIRGEHAHRVCKQFLVCVSGACRVAVDDGQAREDFLLDSPDRGLYLPPMTWATQYKYSADAVLLVFASEYYDSQDYIRNYDEFIRSCGPAGVAKS